MHTLIVGNGIIALTTAFRLLQRASQQDKITIIGRQDRLGSATLAAGAMLNSFAEIERGSLETELDIYRFELSHLATRMWPKFEQELIEAAGVHLPDGCKSCQGFSGGGCVETGTYIVNNAAADDLDDENFDAIREALVEFDEPHRLVSPADIPNYMPEQHYRATRALYIENEGWFNPRLMVEKLDAILRRSPKVQFVEGYADRFLLGAGNISGLVLANGQVFEADKYVLATGATATDLLERSHLDIDMQRVFYGVGVSIEIRSPDFPHTKCIRTPNRGLACGLYSVPFFKGPDEPHNHILLGASNFISPEPYTYGRLTSVESLMRAGIEQINRNFYRADLVRINIGWRPTSQDTYPLVGQSSIPNLIVATGTKRDGFHLSPLFSQFIASIILGETIDERFSVFSPQRKPIQNMTRDQAIEMGVRHQMSAAYQHGFSPAKSRMPDQIKRMYRDDLERLHDLVGAVDWGIPPEMLDMYRYGHAKV